MMSHFNKIFHFIEYFLYACNAILQASIQIKVFKGFCIWQKTSTRCYSFLLYFRFQFSKDFGNCLEQFDIIWHLLND